MRKKFAAFLFTIIMTMMLSVPVAAAASPTGTPSNDKPVAPKTGDVVEYVIVGTGAFAAAAVVSGLKLKKQA